MNCPTNQSISKLNDWCQKCPNLTDCLEPNVVDSLLKFVVKIFYIWEKYFTKRNLIDVSMRKFLIEDYSFKSVMGNYFKNIKPFQNSNLTLLDAWIYCKGDIYNKIRPIEEYIGGFHLYLF